VRKLCARPRRSCTPRHRNIAAAKPGWNGGAGLSLGTRSSAKFYAEARYHRMIFGNHRYVDTVPVTFGIRW
jgi:hypothetical protein